MSDEKLTEDDCTCAGLVSCNYHYPWLNPPTVTISREDLSALLLNYEWLLKHFEGTLDFNPRIVSDELTKALEVQGE